MVNQKSTWKSKEIQSRTDWLYHLDDNDRSEITKAVESVKHLELNKINARNFLLPNLKEKLKKIIDQTEFGLGFANLKGFPVDQFSERENIAGYLGIMSHLGNIRIQNKRGWIMHHVRDVNPDLNQLKTYLTISNVEMDPHTDSCDTVGLLCLNTPAKGGTSTFSSSSAIHNEIKEKYPNYLESLYKFLPYDRRGEVAKDMDPWYMMPVYSMSSEGNLITYFNEHYLNACQREIPHAPRITDTDLEAMACFRNLALSEEFQFRLQLEKGDIQLYNNKFLVHGRTDYTDSPENTRHLLRIWISPTDSCSIPDHFISRWGSTVPGNRGGIYVNNDNSDTFVPLYIDSKNFYSKITA